MLDVPVAEPYQQAIEQEFSVCSFGRNTYHPDSNERKQHLSCSIRDKVTILTDATYMQISMPNVTLRKSQDAYKNTLDLSKHAIIAERKQGFAILPRT